MRAGIMMVWGLVLLAVVLPASAQTNGFAPTEADVAYVPDGAKLQQLDVYLPEGANTPYPTVMVIHGGAFIGGDKSQVMPVARVLTSQGYAVVAINYRLIPAVSYPAPMNDAFCALAWIYGAGEQYGFDPQRVFAWGGSAGAYFSTMIGTVDDARPFLQDCPHDLPDTDWVRGVVAYYPPTNLNSPHFVDGPTIVRFRGDYKIDSPEWLAASPLNLVDGSEPPFFLIHGTSDDVVPIEESLNLEAALKENDVPVSLLVIDDAEHGFMNRVQEEPGQQAIRAAVDFLDELLP